MRQAEPQDARGAEWDRADNVVQQLFAVGLAMHTTRQLCGDRPEVAARISEHMNDLQLIVGQIRSTMLDPPTADPGPPAGCGQRTRTHRSGTTRKPGPPR